MLDWFATNPSIALLKEDHDKVKDLFDRFEKASGRAAKRKIVEDAITELKAHAALEEELFYPAVRKPVGSHLMNEADEEHHVAKVLIAELEAMKGDGDHYDGKFTVLAENVRHHIKEEENEIFPKAKDLPIDFDELSQAMRKRKEELLATGFPRIAEERMVAASHGRGDSSAKAAQKPHKTAKRKKTVSSPVDNFFQRNLVWCEIVKFVDRGDS